MLNREDSRTAIPQLEKMIKEVGNNVVDGKTSYLHIAYANNSTGTDGFSTTYSIAKSYLGQYSDFEEEASTIPSKYSWTLIKGDTGATGEPGADGHSPQVTAEKSGTTTTIKVDETTIATINDGAQGATGATGQDGQDGADGKMLFATSATAAETAAKVATIAPETTATLYVGFTVSVKFTYGNTVSSPTLNINGLGTKSIMLNGVAFAYWLAGETVVFTYDGTCWQVASAPVYADTVTVGNSAGQNIYVDSDSVDIRNGSDVLATFGEITQIGESGKCVKITNNKLSMEVGDEEAFAVWGRDTYVPETYTELTASPEKLSGFNYYRTYLSSDAWWDAGWYKWDVGTPAKTLYFYSEGSYQQEGEAGAMTFTYVIYDPSTPKVVSVQNNGTVLATITYGRVTIKANNIDYSMTDSEYQELVNLLGGG